MESFSEQFGVSIYRYREIYKLVSILWPHYEKVSEVMKETFKFIDDKNERLMVAYIIGYFRCISEQTKEKDSMHIISEN